MVSSSQVIYLHATRPKVQKLQQVANGAKVRSECTVMHRVYSRVRLYNRKTDMLFVLQPKVQPQKWGLQQSHEVWRMTGEVEGFG
jgi:hypothetical protein